MTLHIETQNIKGALNDAVRSSALLTELDGRDEADRPDVMFYSEAYTPGSRRLSIVERAFDSRGYAMVPFDYDDRPERIDAHGGALVFRKDLQRRGVEPEVVRLGGRNAVWAWLQDPETGIGWGAVGTHLKDDGVRARQKMAVALASLATAGGYAEPDEALAVMGTINSLARDDPHAAMLRWALPLRPALRPFAARPGHRPETGWRRKVSLIERSIGMATDGVLNGLQEDLGVKTTDPAATPTVPADNPRLRTTYILTRGMEVHAQGIGERNTDIESGKHNLLAGSLAVWAEVKPIEPVY